MNIAVVGLGLIGGSLCKALKEKTDHRVFGLERNLEVCRQALETGSVDKVIGPEQLHEAHLTVVCLHPEAARAFVLTHQADFAPGSIVADVCGVKGALVSTLTQALHCRKVSFVGMHPMAGKECFGFENSDAHLFERANFVFTICKETNLQALKRLEDLAKALGAGHIVETTPEDHDRIIAYTSQLAHVVSSAYVKSPTMADECGFSGGSFQDMTRIATLNEEMWASLFLLNRDCLAQELHTLIGHLSAYEEALRQRDEQGLTALLKAGRLAKEENLKKRREQNVFK